MTPQAARLFLDVLARGKHTFSGVLTLMNDSGVLGRYLPEWGRIVAQMQFNMYHSYYWWTSTPCRAVGVIADIAAGRLKEDHPLSVDTFPLIAGTRRPCSLAMLLHDTGKGGVGGRGEGRRPFGALGLRNAWGLEPKRVELIAWLVEHHLVMSDFAQKRDVSDPKTVAAFTQIVQNPERPRACLPARPDHRRHPRREAQGCGTAGRAS